MTINPYFTAAEPKGSRNMLSDEGLLFKIQQIAYVTFEESTQLNNRLKFDSGPIIIV